MARASQAKKKKAAGKSGKGSAPPIPAAPPSDPSTPDDDDDSDESSRSRSSGFLTNDSTIEPVRGPAKAPTPKKAAPTPPPPPKGSAAYKKTARKTTGGKGSKPFPKTPQSTPKHGAKAAVKTPAASGSKTPRKPFRYRPGTLALKEIRRYQKGTGHLIPRLPFARLTKEIATTYKYVTFILRHLVFSRGTVLSFVFKLWLQNLRINLDLKVFIAACYLSGQMGI